jgi:hypothetical protein
MTPYNLLSEVEKKVKLQKQKAYEYEGHPIYKYRLNIPSEMIKTLGWDKEKNLELIIRIKEGRIEVIRRSA